MAREIDDDYLESDQYFRDMVEKHGFTEMSAREVLAHNRGEGDDCIAIRPEDAPERRVRRHPAGGED